jgi:predicted PurR-regulated permease PerM
MRFFWTLFWAMLLSNMMNYVIANMQGINYNFQLATIVAVVFSVVIFVIGAIIPDEAV